MSTQADQGGRGLIVATLFALGCGIWLLIGVATELSNLYVLGDRFTLIALENVTRREMVVGGRYVVCNFEVRDYAVKEYKYEKKRSWIPEKTDRWDKVDLAIAPLSFPPDSGDASRPGNTPPGKPISGSITCNHLEGREELNRYLARKAIRVRLVSLATRPGVDGKQEVHVVLEALNDRVPEVRSLVIDTAIGIGFLCFVAWVAFDTFRRPRTDPIVAEGTPTVEDLTR